MKFYNTFNPISDSILKYNKIRPYMQVNNGRLSEIRFVAFTNTIPFTLLSLANDRRLT